MIRKQNREATILYNERLRKYIHFCGKRSMVDFSRQENDLSIRNSADFQLPACLKNAPYKMDPAGGRHATAKNNSELSQYSTNRYSSIDGKKFNFLFPPIQSFIELAPQDESVKMKWFPSGLNRFYKNCNRKNQEERISFNVWIQIN